MIHVKMIFVCKACDGGNGFCIAGGRGNHCCASLGVPCSVTDFSLKNQLDDAHGERFRAWRRLEQLDEQDVDERDDGPITSRPYLHHQAQLRVKRQLVVALARLQELLIPALPGHFIDRNERVVLD
ncbi:hypothetical protein E4U52_006171 [Claviceps spartinae]|nr:hypothetical protein E4U52_006171 [Claviceps spartinae]